jgi:hypothetical protein
MRRMTSDQFSALLRSLTTEDLEAIDRSLGSDAVVDEVEWWRATIAIDRAIRHARRTHQAGRAAADAMALVEAVGRAGAMPEPVVTRVARAAADIARGLAAGPSAQPIVGVLMQHWGPVGAVA